MLKLPPNLIQIAGVIDQQEADLLVSLGVDYLGFPLRLPVHQEDLSEEAAAELISKLEPPNHAVLITYLDQAEEIAQFCQTLGVNIVQLHGDISSAELKQLKDSRPDLSVIKSLVVGLYDQKRLRAMVAESSPYVDAFITDTYDPYTGASGATGKTHNWQYSRELVECSELPVILAGGLTADNVHEAILQVQPFGVDAHTGVEDQSGRKCSEKVSRFVAETKAAFKVLSN